MSADINARGDSSELGAATIIRRFGGQVSFPFGDNAPYDFIADIGGSLYRVQVKSATQRDGENNSIRAPLSTADGYGYGDTVDAVIIYNVPDDEYYWLWPSECAKTVARVCVVPREEVHPPNREQATIAEEVRLRDRISELQT